MSIKSGALRRTFNESLDQKIICKNGLLITLAAINKNPRYSEDEKRKIAKCFLTFGYDIEYIKKIVPQIPSEYWPTNAQIDRLLNILDDYHTKSKYYIKDNLVKFTYHDKFDTPALKRYIFENQMTEMILAELGLDGIQYHENSRFFSCANPDGDNHAAVNVKNNPYLNVRNWTRQKDFDQNADIITLVQYVKKCSFLEAVRWLYSVTKATNNKSKLGSDDTKESIVQTEMPIESLQDAKMDAKMIDESELQRFCPNLYIDWWREGIMPWTRDKFDIRYDTENKRVVIPMRHWQTGEILALNCRTTFEHYELFGIPKYVITKGYQKHLNLYGLYENYEAIQKAGYVVVYESEKSVLKRDSLNDATGVALSGHSVSNAQAKILADLGVEVIFALDKDISPDEVKYMCFQLQQNHPDIQVSYIFDKWDLLGEKDSPADSTNNIFHFLFNNRETFNFPIDGTAASGS